MTLRDPCVFYDGKLIKYKTPVPRKTRDDVWMTPSLSLPSHEEWTADSPMMVSARSDESAEHGDGFPFSKVRVWVWLEFDQSGRSDQTAVRPDRAFLGPLKEVAVPPRSDRTSTSLKGL